MAQPVTFLALCATVTDMTTIETAGSYRSAVAGNVSAELARKQASRATLAKSLGVDPSWVSRRLRGDHPFNVDDLARIAEALDVDVNALTQVRRA